MLVLISPHINLNHTSKSFANMCKTHYIKIQRNTGVPKYRQLMKAILDGIREDTLKIGDRIPSINNISEEYGLSRSTVEKAYIKLRSQKIIKSVKGKGFYIATTDLRIKKSVLFVVNQLNTYTTQLLNTFIKTIGINVKVDVEVYHGELIAFKDMIERKKDQYEHLVLFLKFKKIEQYSINHQEELLHILRAIPEEKLILLDSKIQQFSGKLGQVHQDFEHNFYSVLMDSIENFNKYDQLILIRSKDVLYTPPMHIEVGLKRFCAKYQLDYEIMDKCCDNTVIKSKKLYIVFGELDLIQLLKKAKEEQYQLGEDIGIVSYRDTALKRYLGISVIETNINKIVNAAVEILLQKITKSVRINFDFIKRTSS